jgi:transcriptional regulator GlxA family with amidase domain
MAVTRTDTLTAERRAPGRDRTTIAAVIYPGLTPLDLIGPLRVLSELARIRDDVDVVVVGERAGVVEGDNGLRFVVPNTFGDLTRPSVLLVPGGGRPTLRAMSSEPLRAYIRTASAEAEVVASVCTGALLLASVGLLRGRAATTHWAYRGVLERLGATYLRRRWVEDGRFLTSAGVSAGIDTALHLAERLTDADTARLVQARIDYDPSPPFGGIDYDRIPLAARALRGMHTVLAPLITRRARQLTARSR